MNIDNSRGFPQDIHQRLNGYLVTKVGNFLNAHYIRFKLFDTESLAKAQSALMSRKLKFKKAGMETLIAGGLMMKGN